MKQSEQVYAPFLMLEGGPGSDPVVHKLRAAGYKVVETHGIEQPNRKAKASQMPVLVVMLEDKPRSIPAAVQEYLGGPGSVALVEPDVGGKYPLLYQAEVDAQGRLGARQFFGILRPVYLRFTAGRIFLNNQYYSAG